jgi:hypothetical protein
VDETVMEQSLRTFTRPNSVRLPFTEWKLADDIVVETADKVNGKKYKQIFSQNMTKKGTPKVC